MTVGKTVGHWLKWNEMAQKPLGCAGMVILKTKDSRELEILNPEACLRGLFFPKKLRKLLSACSRKARRYQSDILERIALR